MRRRKAAVESAAGPFVRPKLPLGSTKTASEGAALAPSKVDGAVPGAVPGAAEKAAEARWSAGVPFYPLTSTGDRQPLVRLQRLFDKHPGGRAVILDRATASRTPRSCSSRTTTTTRAREQPIRKYEVTD